MGNLGLFPSSLDTYVGGFENSSTASGAKPFWVEGARGSSRKLFFVHRKKSIFNTKRFFVQ